MSLKRLAPLVVLASLTAVVLVSAAPAGSIDDGDPCPKDGSGNLICPVGTEGAPYSIKFHGDEDPICAPGDDKWYANGGTPPGLALAENGQLSGTPTQAGTYAFWLELKLPDYTNPDGSGCSSRDNSEERVVITINPGIPKLTIGPESAPVGTVSNPYSLQMTASVSDPKTWSINSGALPPGLALDPSTGLISGMPTTPGTFTFEVLARVVSDQRSDTKTLGIVVRPQLAIASASIPLASEVGVRFLYPLTASGGTEQYTWSLTAGALPAGVVLEPTGALAGVPEEPGRFPFTVSVLDTEGRVATFGGRLLVADRLSIVVKRLRATKVGRFYRLKLRSIGGVKPTTWRIKRGPLPRGVRFDRELGMFVGTPRRARTYRIGVEARDALRVKATATIVVVVKPAKKPKSEK